ncbi:MAG: hypothetical protein J6Y62_03950 [Clostridia bacterium]|nr:hypothetical protein [Clostridia bacterium]
MRLSDCRTWDQIEAFKKAVLPCRIEGWRLRFYGWDELEIVPRGRRFMAMKGDVKLDELLDEKEMMEGPWRHTQVDFIYRKIVLAQPKAGWVFTEEETVSAELFETPWSIQVMLAGPFGDFYVEALVKRACDVKAAKKAMLAAARDLADNQLAECRKRAEGLKGVTAE